MTDVAAHDRVLLYDHGGHNFTYGRVGAPLDR